MEYRCDACGADAVPETAGVGGALFGAKANRNIIPAGWEWRQARDSKILLCAGCAEQMEAVIGDSLALRAQT